MTVSIQRSIVVTLALFLFITALHLPTDANAGIRIRNDLGGRIDGHIHSFSQMRDAGRSVIIDGTCLSACTLVLGILPPERICVTPRARLGFHAAWAFDYNGRRIASDWGTATMWRIYPPTIRSWINRKGGLSQKMIFLQGRELAALYRRC